MADATPRTPGLEKLREIIVAFAAQNGESEPTRVRMVEATSTAARAALAGDRDNQPPIPVYVVVADGEFVGYMTKRPLGAPPPKGTTLFMLLERNATFSSVGWGLRRSTTFERSGLSRRSEGRLVGAGELEKPKDRSRGPQGIRSQAVVAGGSSY